MHAVLNWLWQGCIVALALFAMLHLLERARAQVRYVVCWVAQLFVIALPVVAFLEPSPGQPGPLPRVPVAGLHLDRSEHSPADLHDLARLDVRASH